MADTPENAAASDTFFDRYKERLRRTVRLRLDRRLSGMIDSSGVLRLAREAAIQRVAEFTSAPPANPFLWFRQITGEVLAQLHREQLGDNARGDISLYRSALPEATSVSLAAHLLGKDVAEDQAAARGRSSCRPVRLPTPITSVGSSVRRGQQRSSTTRTSCRCSGSCIMKERTFM